MSFKLITFAFIFTAFVIYNTIYNNTLVKCQEKEITKKQFYKSIRRVRMGLKRSPVWHLAMVAKADVNYETLANTKLRVPTTSDEQCE